MKFTLRPHRYEPDATGVPYLWPWEVFTRQHGPIAPVPAPRATCARPGCDNRVPEVREHSNAAVAAFCEPCRHSGNRAIVEGRATDANVAGYLMARPVG